MCITKACCRYCKEQCLSAPFLYLDKSERGTLIWSGFASKGLYRPQFEHDNCGIGAVVNIKGIKTHQTVENALRIVENLEHRAGKDAEGKTGDGVGIHASDFPQILLKESVKPLGI